MVRYLISSGVWGAAIVRGRHLLVSGISFGPRLKLCCLLEGNSYLRSSTQREYGTRFRWELLPAYMWPNLFKIFRRFKIPWWILWRWKQPRIIKPKRGFKFSLDFLYCAQPITLLDSLSCNIITNNSWVMQVFGMQIYIQDKRKVSFEKFFWVGVVSHA